ncbi:MAG: hypothetical protein A2033_02210 [Bacteroidetes bacterium GWA2_31_9]|nr:MAG: hypothetical protein A2033_02210 [Bacteroidetes bacterium GWA2_31_9]
MRIILRIKAQKSISDIAEYIENNGFPGTALSFIARIEKFTESLVIFPNKYPICRQQKFTKRSYRCAVFESDYIFVFKAVNNQLIIYNIIHSKRLK